MRNNNFWFYCALMIGIFVGTGSMLLDLRMNKKDCPKQEGCNCISPREVLRINARYVNFLDSLNYSGKKKDRPRYQDSVNRLYNQLFYKQ